MHYYKFNIGDYASHTQHLDPIEDIAYRRMLDWVYLHESPLPDSPEQIGRLIRMRTHSECIAVVLQEFFVLTDHGWMQEKADAEIQAYNEKSTKAKASAAARWANKPIKSNANALPTESERNANHKPLTTNQEPLNNNQEPKEKINKKDDFMLPDFITSEEWSEVQAIKKRATKVALTPRARTTLINGLKKIVDAGYTMEQVLNLWSEYPHWKTITLEYMNSKLSNASFQQSGPQQFSKVTQQNIVTAENWLRKKQNEPN